MANPNNAPLKKIISFYLRFTPSYSQIGYYARRLFWRRLRCNFEGQTWLVVGGSEGGTTRGEGLGLGHGRRVDGTQVATGAQRTGHGDLRDGAIGQQRRGVDRVVAGVDTGSGHRADVLAAADTLLGELPLGAAWLPALAMREDQGAERRGDEEASNDLKGEEVLAEEQARDSLDVAAVLRIRRIEPHRRHAAQGSADSEDEQDPEAGSEKDADHALALERLDE